VAERPHWFIAFCQIFNSLRVKRSTHPGLFSNLLPLLSLPPSFPPSLLPSLPPSLTSNLSENRRVIYGNPALQIHNLLSGPVLSPSLPRSPPSFPPSLPPPLSPSLPSFLPV